MNEITKLNHINYVLEGFCKLTAGLERLKLMDLQDAYHISDLCHKVLSYAQIIKNNQSTLLQIIERDLPLAHKNVIARSIQFFQKDPQSSIDLGSIHRAAKFLQANIEQLIEVFPDKKSVIELPYLLPKTVNKVLHNQNCQFTGKKQITGRGKFGQVRLLKLDGIPTCQKEAIDQRAAAEMKKMNQLARCLGGKFTPKIHLSSQENQNFIFLEQGEQTLYDLSKSPLDSIENFSSIANDLLRSCNALHQKGYIHSDIKPLNIMRFNDQWLLIDFDNIIPDQAKNPLVGTPYYLSQNRLGCTTKKGCCIVASIKDDSWALGITLFQVLTGKLWLKDEVFEERIDLFRAIASLTQQEVDSILLHALENPDTIDHAVYEKHLIVNLTSDPFGIYNLLYEFLGKEEFVIFNELMTNVCNEDIHPAEKFACIAKKSMQIMMTIIKKVMGNRDNMTQFLEKYAEYFISPHDEILKLKEQYRETYRRGLQLISHLLCIDESERLSCAEAFDKLFPVNLEPDEDFLSFEDMYASEDNWSPDYSLEQNSIEFDLAVAKLKEKYQLTQELDSEKSVDFIQINNDEKAACNVAHTPNSVSSGESTPFSSGSSF